MKQNTAHISKAEYARMLAGLQEITNLLKRLILPLILLLIIASYTTSSQAQDLLVVQFQPAEIQQGRTALIRVAGTPDLTRVEALLDGEHFPLYRSIDGDWVGFFPAAMSAERGAFQIAFQSWRGDEANPPQSETVNVVWGGFLYQDIVLPHALSDLLDPELNQWEVDTLKRVYSRYTPEKLWEGELLPPVPGQQISEFGGIRNYNNGVLEGRHTGTDYRAGLGRTRQRGGSRASRLCELFACAWQPHRGRSWNRRADRLLAPERDVRRARSARAGRRCDRRGGCNGPRTGRTFALRNCG